MTLRTALAALALGIAPVAVVQAQPWNAAFEETERGHRLGNPEAPAQLIAFVSYSCPACERFERESEAALKMLYIDQGRVAVEIRPEIHSPIDLAAALAVRCGPTEKFFANHRAMYAAQGEFLAKAQATTPAQRGRWFSGSQAERMSAVASDLDFYEIMERRGYSFGELSRCLSDVSAAIDILGDETANSREFAVQGTPSFALNGQLLENVHSWAALQPLLDAAAQ